MLQGRLGAAGPVRVLQGQEGRLAQEGAGGGGGRARGLPAALADQVALPLPVAVTHQGATLLQVRTDPADRGAENRGAVRQGASSCRLRQGLHR